MTIPHSIQWWTNKRFTPWRRTHHAASHDPWRQGTQQISFKLLPSTLCLLLHSADDSNPICKTQIELVFSTLFSPSRYFIFLLRSLLNVIESSSWNLNAVDPLQKWGCINSGQLSVSAMQIFSHEKQQLSPPSYLGKSLIDLHLILDIFSSYPKIFRYNFLPRWLFFKFY